MRDLSKPPPVLGVEIEAGDATLVGDLCVPAQAQGIVLFAHGSGSSRLSPRNQFVAHVLQEANLATLLFDLLTADEEALDLYTRHYRFDIELLTARLVAATDWVGRRQDTRRLAVGYFGSSTGAAAALMAAARHPAVAAVVSRGGRPDLAMAVLPQIKSPTLLIVGGNDATVIDLNEQALAHLHTEAKIEIVPGATHLFEEPGALEQVAHLAQAWFSTHLRAA